MDSVVGRWSDVGTTFVYMIYIVWPICFLEPVPYSEKNIPWSDDGMYFAASWSMLSVGYDSHHTCLGLVCNIIRFEGYIWVVTLSPSFTIKGFGFLTILNDGELGRYNPLLYQLVAKRVQHIPE